MKEKVFADGFRFSRRENAPDFVVGQLSARVEDAIAMLRRNEKGGWVNMNIMIGRTGNYYLEVDTFERKSEGKAAAPAPAPAKSVPTISDDIPF